MRRLWLLLCLGACTEPLPAADAPPELWPANTEAGYVEDTDNAAWLIWGTLHGDGRWPEIYWFYGNCLKDLPGSGAQCHSGFYDRFRWRIFLLTRDKPSQSAIAHELIHADLHQRLGDPDPGHTLEDWELEVPLSGMAAKQGW